MVRFDLRMGSMFWSNLLTFLQSITTTLALSKNTIAAWPKAA